MAADETEVRRAEAGGLRVGLVPVRVQQRHLTDRVQSRDLLDRQRQLGGRQVVEQLLLAAIGLLVGVVVLAAAARARRARRRTVPDAVPLWWDQSPATGASAGTPGSPTPV